MISIYDKYTDIITLFLFGLYVTGRRNNDELLEGINYLFYFYSYKYIQITE
jgi:hypothetical protein